MTRVKVYKSYNVLCEYGADRPNANVQVYAKTEQEALNKAKELVNRWRYTVTEVSEIQV
jgi:hypothetical protein